MRDKKATRHRLTFEQQAVMSSMGMLLCSEVGESDLEAATRVFGTVEAAREGCLHTATRRWPRIRHRDGVRRSGGSSSAAASRLVLTSRRPSFANSASSPPPRKRSLRSGAGWCLRRPAILVSAK